MATKTSGVFEEEDRNALMAEVARIGAKTALEFGPGYSTYALIDAGCTVDSFEHTDKWRRRAAELFAACPQVRISTYENKATVEIRNGAWDIAFVDSPVGQGRRRVFQPGQEDCSRLNTVKCAIQRSPVVLLHDARREGEQGTLRRMELLGYTVEMIETRKGIARIHGFQAR